MSQVAQVNPAKAKASVLVSPHPRNNALFGFAIGLLLAAFAAYASAGSTAGCVRWRPSKRSSRHRSWRRCGPSGVRSISRDGHLAPADVLREALWRLQTTLRVGKQRAERDVDAAANGQGRSPRTILCVSADAGDGKSTLIAALALAWGEAGERVAVVEADFRRPVQSRLLQLSGSHGLADVLTGMLPVEEAMQPVSCHAPGGGRRRR